MLQDVVGIICDGLIDIPSLDHEGFADDLLRTAEAIGGSGVDGGPHVRLPRE